MKILGGTFKGRNIIAPRDARPVSVRVRKSCFDMLGDEVRDKSVLDVFCGSGSLAIEALSRGSGQAILIDSASGSISAAGKNISTLALESRVQIYQKDVFLAIRDFSVAGKQFDVIFMDPPYYQGMLKKALQAIAEYDILANSGYLVGFCYSKDDYPKELGLFSLIVDKKYGQTKVLIYTKHP